MFLAQAKPEWQWSLAYILSPMKLEVVRKSQLSIFLTVQKADARTSSFRY